MSANQFPIHVGKIHNEFTQLLPGHSTRFRPIYTPDSSNGSRITHINVSTNDTGANTYEFAIARLVSDIGVSGAFVDGGVGSDTITDSGNSFVTSGWLVGDRFTVVGATTLANDFVAFLTAVAAGTLTFATATVNTAETFDANTKIYRIHQLHTKTLPLSSGYTNAAVAVSGLDSTQQPGLDFAPNRYLKLAPGDILMAKVGTLLGTGEVADFSVFGDDYTL